MSRYIDAERLKQFLKPIEWGTPDERWIPEHEIGAMLDYFPAADVAEVRHGRWEIEAEFKYKRGGRNTEAKQIFGTEWRTMQRLKCSVCGMVVLVDDTIKYEYCPHCGARCEE